VIRVVCAALTDRGRVFAARRAPGRALAGAWEFPGGKVEPGESDQEALARELREELGLEVAVGPCLGASHHQLPSGAPLVLVCYACEAPNAAPTLVDHDAAVWLAPDALPGLPWAEADRPLLAPVAAWLKNHPIDAR
jgi:8-oxo-dGTP diphosphatase